MRLILGLLGLAAVAIALERRFDPPQPRVLIDVPDPSRPPLEDLNLKGSDHA